MAVRRTTGRSAVRANLAHAAIIACGAGGLLAWTAVLAVGRHSATFVQDWIVYAAAGTAALEGKVALLFDAARFTAYQHATFARWYEAPASLHPWLYPPHDLLLLAPLATLPFAVSYALFQLGTAAAAVAAVASRGLGRGRDWWRGILLLLFPASCINALTGQNALLMTALLVGGLRLVERRPALGGAVLSLLSLKPHFLLVVPVAIVALRAWRALAACGATALLLVAASAALFGTEAWRLWLTQTVLAGDPALPAWYADTFLHGYGVYVCATLLGASGSLALATQIAGACASVACVWTVFRRAVSTDLRIATALVAAVAAAPHVMAYDLAMLGAAVILLFTEAAEGIGIGATLLFGIAWVAPLLRPIMVASGRVLIPAMLVGLLVYALQRAQGTAKAERAAVS